MTEALTEEELTFLRSLFDLARAGDTARLDEAVGAGLPVNLTNEAGDSLLILAAYHDHPDTVRALLDRGADTARVNDRVRPRSERRCSVAPSATSPTS